ncbi:MAG: xylulokinase [Bacteroidales bacterium]
MYLLGLDIGSSFVKASVIDAESGRLMAMAHSPDREMPVSAPRAGWAEQDPEMWWENTRLAIKKCLDTEYIEGTAIKAVGISYQMHGLVIVDREMNIIRPSIIWCDSRAVPYGNEAYEQLGHSYCNGNLLNSPGNFTASKLAWLRDKEPGNYKRIYKLMLPGDYIAMKLSGEIYTTAGGLSEGIFWDFPENRISERILDYFGFGCDLFPAIVPSFAIQGNLLAEVAEELGLKKGTPVSYRAGDQPNNAFSLKVMEPGEVAATAGTSGVLYGITDKLMTDKRSRVNIFAHVNHSNDRKRLAMLACINGTGIMNAWLRKNCSPELSYDKMNKLAEQVSQGSDGLTVYPFGNGAERLLENRNPGASFRKLDLNIHGTQHLYRAVQEGIAYSFKYAFDIMKESGMDISLVRAGRANMFLSPLFTRLLADLTGTPVLLYNTEGSAGAARGAGLGAGIFKHVNDAFTGMERVSQVEPEREGSTVYSELYTEWKQTLIRDLESG